MRREATPRQREILSLIERLAAQRGYPPTIRELATAAGIRSTNGVFCHLGALERHGLIEWDSRVSRGIRIVKEREGMGDEKRKELAGRIKRLLALASEPPWSSHATPYSQTDAQVRGRTGKMVAVVSNEEDAELIAQAPSVLSEALAALSGAPSSEALVEACAKAVLDAGGSGAVADAVRRAGRAAAGRVA